MSSLVIGQDKIVADWVSTRIHGGVGSIQEPYTAIGIQDKTGSLIGATVFNNYYPDAGVIEMHSASISPKWLTREMINAIFEYPFTGLGCQMVVLRVSEKNRRMLNIGRRFGFSEYTIPRLRGRNEDEIILTFTQEAWLISRYNYNDKKQA